jgi:predicted esterase
MDINLEEIEVKKTARLAIVGELGEDIRECIVVAHGYGHLAPYFIRNLTGLSRKHRLIICPEGLSRFYLQGASGRVGASWMTKESRETDIMDYLNYLDTVWNWVGEQCPNLSLRVMAGFSQGAATAARYTFYAADSIDRLLLCSGAFPPDLAWPESKSVSFSTFFIYGTEDPYLEQFPPEQLLAMPLFYRLNPTILKFEGKHELNLALMELALTCS